MSYKSKIHYHFFASHFLACSVNMWTEHPDSQKTHFRGNLLQKISCDMYEAVIATARHLLQHCKIKFHISPRTDVNVLQRFYQIWREWELRLYLDPNAKHPCLQLSMVMQTFLQTHWGPSSSNENQLYDENPSVKYIVYLYIFIYLIYLYIHKRNCQGTTKSRALEPATFQPSIRLD